MAIVSDAKKKKQAQESMFAAAFCNNGGDAYKAAKSIGIDTSHASDYAKKFMASSNVQKEINKIKDKLVATIVITQHDVTQELWEILSNKGYEPSDRIKAAAEINKMHGWLEAERKVIDSNINANVNSRNLSAVAILPSNGREAAVAQRMISNLQDIAQGRAQSQNPHKLALISQLSEMTTAELDSNSNN